MEQTFLQSVSYKNGVLRILDQTKIPELTEFIDITQIEDTWDAIKKLKVRGAPAIGITAAFGLLLGIKDAPETSFEDFFIYLKKQSEFLATSRPTAVNLFWALKRMEVRALKEKGRPVARIKAALEEEAHTIRKEDEEVCRSIGEYALTLLSDGMGVLTHCNPGGIATARYGTALAPLYLAKEKGWNIKVFADETRPLLQGARLTTWELMQAEIDVTLITDSMAALVMQKGWVQAVIVGCDRVAANGDIANKIGTYGVALLAKAHHIPFYVAAPISTIDLDTKTGDEIIIEEREASEITHGFGKRTTPENVKVFNPAFDVTPHELVTAIITEKGILTGNYQEQLKDLLSS